MDATRQVARSYEISTKVAQLHQKRTKLAQEHFSKRLSSAYAAGRRNGAWIKVKRRAKLQAVIIGFIEKDDDFKSLLLAANGEAGLRYVGKVGGGFTDAQRVQLNRILRAKPRRSPLVPCDERARWIEPEYYCTVSFADWTQGGMLRAPVFEGMIEE